MQFCKFLILTFCISTLAHANIKIHNILAPVANDDVYLILANSGIVYEVEKDKTEIINNAYFAFENNLSIDLKTSGILKILTDKREKVLDLSFTPSTKSISAQVYTSENIPTPLNNYLVNTVDDIETINDYFNTMNRRTRRFSQCYNRAHMWSYELHKKFNLNLGKIWIFFTSKYIRDFKYKWWFHIAPYLDLKNRNSSYVMDRSFTKKPLKVKEWTDIFMENKSECKEVEFYSDYRENQNSEYCYLIKSSMYYWQPFNIEGLQNGEEEKVRFETEELERAYKNAARGWDGEL